MQTSFIHVSLALSFLASLSTATAAKFRPNSSPTAGDLVFDKYFEAETRKISEASLTDIETLEDWNTARVKFRKQLYEMLGLDPLPPKTELKATITGKVDHPDFTVEKIHYQSMPGFYVTGSLYVPRD